MANAVLYLQTGQSLALGGAVQATTVSEYPSNTSKANGAALVGSGSSSQPSVISACFRVWEELSGDSDDVTLVMGDWSALSGANLATIDSPSATYSALVALPATAAGSHTVRVPGVIFIQGESDQRDETDPATWRGLLSGLRDDVDAAVKAATGQSDEVKFFVCQTSSWDQYTPPAPSIGLAQLAECITNPNMFMVGPIYPCGYGADEIHLTAAGYYHLGEYIARALISQYDTNYWEPLRPLSATRSGAVITVEFNVPAAPLKFDTTIVAAQTNQGFSYTDDGTPPTISGVALGGNGTSVEITLASTPTGANQKIRYGFTTQYGNLCDSETETSVHDAATLANWCVHFEMDVTT